MAPELAAAAFEPFVRGSGREGGTGTGLGLPICKRIVEAAGGSITLTSTPGQGTVVAITLPRADPMEAGTDGFEGGSAGSITPAPARTNAACSRAA